MKGRAASRAACNARPTSPRTLVDDGLAWVLQADSWVGSGELSRRKPVRSVVSEVDCTAGSPHPGPLPEGEGGKNSGALQDGASRKRRPPLPPGEGWGEGASGRAVAVVTARQAFHPTGTLPSDPTRALQRGSKADDGLRAHES